MPEKNQNNKNSSIIEVRVKGKKSLQNVD